ncbi:Sedlin, region [Trichinella nativa]|uniref:Sedlin, region n=3 Tax=Trichinella TaxID=6333 RepID=A0A1Y3E4A7_9BILA|nr:putative trafficking protein particle complex subunit 2 [Trichinella sp. T6]OUC39964.1 Sedlin, region [Trichinella nativa]
MEKTSAKEYYFAIVDMNDRLMFELNISKKNDFDSMLLKQLIAHASLDIVDEAAAEQSHMMIKQVEKYNEWNISAFVTSSGVRFLMLHTAKNDEGIKNFFIEIYEMYIKLAMNPFHRIGEKIESPAFHKRAQLYGRKYLLA